MSMHWLSRDTVLAIHEAQIAEHGGVPGLRDPGLLDTALDHPRQMAAGASMLPDVATLGAAYAMALMRHRPFVAGDERVALVALELFLMLNGLALRADDAACVRAFNAFASGTLSEAVFTEWVRDCSRPFAA